MDNSEHIILYGPKDGKNILRSYPELAENPIFKGINSDELLFAWYIGISNSPVEEDWPISTRYRVAANKAFSDKNHKKVSFAAGEIPDTVKAAIQEFGKLAPEARNLANKMTQTAFKKLNEMVNVDVQKDFLYTDKDGNLLVDHSGKKSFVDMVHRMTETIPTLLKQMEQGYGVSDNRKKEEFFGVKPIDLYHQQKKEKS